MENRRLSDLILERFGDPIGDYAGNPPVGVRDESDICEKCGMMEVEGTCGCTHEVSEAKKKGLWENIHARRKVGKRPKRPGEKGYPKTLDIEK